MRFAIQRIALQPRAIRFLSTSVALQADGPSSSGSNNAALSPTGKKYPKFLRRTRQDEEEMLWDLDEVEEEDERHMSSFGWEIWHQQRDFFNTMRTLERDQPVLEKYRRPFNPPSPTQTSVLVRSVTYAGEPYHPVTRKRAITVPVSLLPLANPTAIHNVKVLADTRWTTEPPKDAGLPQERHTPVFADKEKNMDGEKMSEHGYIKISCESFPEGQMNLKWCMDTLRKLVKEANERSLNEASSFADIPLPTRHQDTRLRAHGTGGGSYKGEKKRVTIKDFPKEWLPNPTP